MPDLRAASRSEPRTVYNPKGMPSPTPQSESKRDDNPPGKSSSGIATLVQAEKLMQIAILLPSAAFLGWALGAWADSGLHTKWWGIVGILFGGISGLVYVVRLVMASSTGNGRGSRL